MMDSADHLIDVIVDFTGVDTFPPNALSSFQYYAKHKSANRRHIIVIGDHPLFKTLANNFATLAQRMHQEIYIVATFDEAKRLISECDQPTNE